MSADPAEKHLLFDHLPRSLVVMENRWPSGTSTGWHTHPTGQLLYATEGVMLVDTDAGSWVVTPNRALWMLAGLRHNVTMSGEVLIRTAYIDTARIPTLPQKSCVLNVSPLLRELLVEAVRIAPGSEAHGRDARLLDLLLDEIRMSPVLPLHLPMPHEGRLKTLCMTLGTRPAAADSAADWAASIGVGERTLHRMFVKETGMTFATWREQARLLHALQRIANEDKIIDVALDCGYASPSAFAAMFKRHFGVTPTSFFK